MQEQGQAHLGAVDDYPSMNRHHQPERSLPPLISLHQAHQSAVLAAAR